MHLDSYDAIESFTDAELGKLTRLIFRHHRNPNNPVGFHVSPKVQTAFAFFKAQFLRDDEKYQEIAAIRSEVGKRGGLASAEKRWGKSEATVVSKSKQTNQVVKKVSKVTVSDSDIAAAVNNEELVPSVNPEKKTLSLQEAWDLNSAAALESRNITDSRAITAMRQEFLTRAKYPTQKAVEGFIGSFRKTPISSVNDWKNEYPKG